MPLTHHCTRCGAVLASFGADALCPQCMVAQAVGLGLNAGEPVPDQRLADTERVSLPTGDAPGARLDQFKLLQQIGAGGMGTVWMAEQTAPVRRLVALKLIKPGMDSGNVLARFEAERQALALMDHPNIAKVLDAGSTPEGRPYFVMELVKGIPLTKYCDEKRLSIRERLELFMPVCQAIQHAHQKGVIHRDIKPSNVLVALYDGRPVPKVIDFGIAKATGQPLTERTLFTEFGALIGTPEYMSPEQAEFNQVDIDTRSDIYSLGVLLYELLTGTTPITREALAKAAFDEILRRVREEEPPRPSTRLTESKDRLASISAQRRLEPGQLAHQVRGDLDWIVMKALEKDRNRRYETANGLAADIKRHLGSEPVVARPPGTAYRLQKFVRRNRGAVAAAAALAAALVVGAGVSAWQWREAVAARRTETKARAQANDLLARVQVQRAKELFALDDDPAAIATLARVLRVDPSNHVAAHLLISALTRGDFPLEPVPPSERHRADSPRLLVESNGVLQVVDAWTGAARNLSSTEALNQWRDWAQRGRNPGALNRWTREQRNRSRADFSADGRKIITMENSVLRIWDAQNGNLVFTTEGQGDRFEFQASLGLKHWMLGDVGLWGMRDSTNVVVVDVRTGNAAALGLPNFTRGNWTEVVTPDRGCLAIWSEQGTVSLFQSGGDLNSPLSLKHPQPEFIGARFSADGTRLATMGSRTICIWDTASGKRLATANEPLNVSQRVVSDVDLFTFTPDGHEYAMASSDHSVRLFDTRTSRQWTISHPDAVQSVQFSPDGKRIVTVCQDHAVRIWNRETGELVGEPVKHKGRVFPVAFSPDGERFATSSEDRTLRLVRWADGRLLGEPLQHRTAISSVEFSPDGSQLRTRSGQGILRIWDASTGEPLTRPVYRPVKPAFIAGVRNILAEFPSEVDRSWNQMPRQMLVERLEPIGGVRFAEMDPNGQVAVVITTSNTLCVWDLPKGRLRFPPIADQTDARVSPDGARVFTFSAHAPDPTNSIVVIGQLWDSITGAPIGPPDRRAEVGIDRFGVRDFHFSADGRRVVARFWKRVAHPDLREQEYLREGSSVHLWDGQTGVPIQSLVENVWGPISAAFTSDGTKVMAVGEDAKVVVFDAATGHPIREFQCSGLTPETDGRRVVSPFGYWSLEADDFRHTALEGMAFYRLNDSFSPSFSPDGAKVLGWAGSNTICTVWDSRTGARLFAPLQQQNRVAWAGFSPDSRNLAALSEDGTARILDAQTGAPVCESLSHGAELTMGEFSPDSRRLFTGSRDGFVRVWDVQTGRLVSEPLAHDGAVQSLRFTRDGRWLLTTTDKSLHLWDVDTSYAPVEPWLLDLAEAVVGQRLNEQNVLEPVHFEAFLKLKRKILQSTNSNYFTRWARWFVADRGTRTISSSSSITVPEYVQHRIEEDTLESLREAVRVASDNARALARLARQIFAQTPEKYPRREVEADLLSRKAVALAPNDAETLKIRAEITNRLNEESRP